MMYKDKLNLLDNILVCRNKYDIIFSNKNKLHVHIFLIYFFLSRK